MAGEGRESVCWFQCRSFFCKISWRTLDVFGDVRLYNKNNAAFLPALFLPELPAILSLVFLLLRFFLFLLLL